MKMNKIIKTALCFIAVSAILPGMAFSQEAAAPAPALDPGTCFESRGSIEDGEVVGYSIRAVEEIDAPFYKRAMPNVKCSPTTGGVLWWSDPFYGTVEMGDMPVEADYTHEEAVVRPREEILMDVIGLYPCADMCHGDPEVVPVPKDRTPRVLEQMHLEKAVQPTDLKHGRGAIWCLECHSRTNRNKLIDHRNNEISFNQPQKLCGKCHGQIYRDWRDGIHGKRTGMWTAGGKKRWWVCTECHDPHNVQQAPVNRGFAQLDPEPAPELPKGMHNTDHEQEHGGGHDVAGHGEAAAH